MISFFRINDPFRLVIVFIVLLIIRLFIILDIPPLTVPELNALIIGEKMGDSYQMYADIWDNTGPIAAGIYWVLDELFGKNILVHHILAMLLIFVQATYFNQMLIRKEQFRNREKTYLPAFLYVIFAAMSFDMMTLSPPLIALTFLLVVIRKVFSVNDKANNDDILISGVYLGIAMMLYLPSGFFAIFVMLGFALFRTVTFRQYMLLMYGISFSFGVIILYYYWMGAHQEFFTNYMLTLFSISSTGLVNLWSLGLLMLTPFLWLLLGMSKVFFGRTSFINYQTNCQFLMLVWLVIVTICLLFSFRLTTSYLILYVPALTFFTAHYFMLVRRKLLAELSLATMLTLILTVSFGMYYGTEYFKRFNYDKLTVEENQAIASKKILVLGEKLSLYHHNKLATPYLNWKLAQQHFKNLHYYDMLLTIYDNFQKDQPEIIIDEARFIPILFDKIPLLAKDYQQDRQHKHIYYLRKTSTKSLSSNQIIE